MKNVTAHNEQNLTACTLNLYLLHLENVEGVPLLVQNPNEVLLKYLSCTDAHTLYKLQTFITLGVNRPKVYIYKGC